ncbi:IS110 family transposase [Streptomyces sp. NPDC004629]|uniref:IS110 family transposase n=1 Tax=Streptomyces sp. NPDC004629 TaxID=3364705 RepID=UPI00368C679C
MTAAILPLLVDSVQPEAVLGVDTHKDVHVAAVTDHLGRVKGSEAFPATAAGYVELLSWAGEFGDIRRAGVEGTGSYGAGLCRFLQAQGVEVIEVNRPDRAKRRSRGKNDTVDAEAAAQAVVSERATAVPKSGDGPVEQIRVYKMARDSAVKARKQAINQLKAILINADPALREQLSGLGRAALVTACVGLDDTKHAGGAAVLHTLRTLARRVKALAAEAADLAKRMEALVKRVAPALLEEHGVGVDSAACLLVAAGDNPERLADEAAFAALCGVSPVERSSGKTHRHRLNRGGDRQANAALFRIVLTRLRGEPRTVTYIERRTAQGKTKREIIRCLKRYLARHLFNIIQHAMATQPDSAAA